MNHEPEFFRSKDAEYYVKIDELQGKVTELKFQNVDQVDGRYRHVLTLPYDEEMANRIRNSYFKITADEFKVIAINMQEENAKSLFA